MANVNANATVKKFDTATDKSTKALVTAAANLTKVTAELTAQVNLHESLSEAIQVSQHQLNDLDNQLDIKTREHNADLALRIRENEVKVITELLKKTGRADITVDELVALESERDSLAADQEAAISKAVGAKVAVMSAAAEAREKELAAQHSVETADLKARIAALESQNGYLTQQVDTYKQMLDDEREARVKSADAAARAAEANRQAISGSQGR